jgi:hypothetical protein
VLAHPEDHEADHHDRHRGDDRLEPFLPGLRELPVEYLQADCCARAECDRDRDAEPHQAQRVGAPLLLQEGGDDPDDERRLDAFAEADHERCDHDQQL